MLFGDLFLEDLLVLTSHLVWTFTFYINQKAFTHSWPAFSKWKKASVFLGPPL